MIRPFVADDLLNIKMREQDEYIFAGYENLTKEQVAKMYEQESISFTAVHNGEIVAIGGIYELWQGVANTFLIASELLYSKPKLVASGCKKILDSIEKAITLHRIQTPVLETDTKAIRFIEWLGFHKESLMLQYDNKKRNYYMYVRFN